MSVFLIGMSIPQIKLPLLLLCPTVKNVIIVLLIDKFSRSLFVCRTCVHIVTEIE